MFRGLFITFSKFYKLCAGWILMKRNYQNHLMRMKIINYCLVTIFIIYTKCKEYNFILFSSLNMTSFQNCGQIWHNICTTETYYEHSTHLVTASLLLWDQITGTFLGFVSQYSQRFTNLIIRPQRALLSL